MAGDSPKPLFRPRLERLVRGLQTRFSSSAQAVVLEVDRLSEQQILLDARHVEELSELEQARRTQREATTNEWDEFLAARWDDAEMRAFKAVHDTASRQGNARRAARKQAEQLTADLRKHAGDLEKAFLRAKDAPIARLNRFRSQIDELAQQLTAVEQATESLLVQRSLSPPEVDTAAFVYEQPKNSEVALQSLQTAVAAARTASDRLANHPTAKFFESPAWWGICGLLFVLVTLAVRLSGLSNWLVACLMGAVVMVAAFLLSLIGLRPWLRKLAAAEYPNYLRNVWLGRGVYQDASRLAIAENDSELKRLAALRDQQFEQAKQARELEAKQLNEKLERDLAQLSATAVTEKQLAAQQLTKAIADCDAEYSQRLQIEWQRFSERRDTLIASMQQAKQELASNMERLQRGGALRQTTAAQKAIQVIERSQRWCQQSFPPWEQLQTANERWPIAQQKPIISLGDLPLAKLLPASAQPAAATQLNAPLLFSPLDDGYLTVSVEPNTRVAKDLIRNLVMRALTTLPAGRTQVCVIDPPGLGRDFGWLMHLGDFDPQLVWHRVWTQPGHIARQLSDLALAAEDFIQQSLRNQYRDIVDYNTDAGALAEPFRLLVWSSFPNGLDDHSSKHLRSLLDIGTRCGIIPILIIDPSTSWPNPELRELVQRHGMHLRYDDSSQSLHTTVEPLAQFSVIAEPAADEEQASQIMQAVGRRSLMAGRVEVPLERIVPVPEQRWQGNSSHALEIPIGQSGVGRVHSLKLGVGTAQHAIIAGKTGSGKSSLLHAIITSAALKYSPERLRLVLLDFKKGVEFQVYAEVGLPHADIIGIESHREFGLSALEYVDACMQRRGEAFRQAAVQDLASWNALHPQQLMPRILFVIDEFQELFVEDDKLSGQASLILDRIVRQGRSFGVHALLSSQTLAGAYSLPRTTLGQMAVRIALQCDASDAQIIFADDNPAAMRLKVPGQAVYNDAGGRIEGNQPMQIGWLVKEQQVSWLRQLPSGYQNTDATTNRLGRCVVYEGNHSAKWSRPNAELAMATAHAEINSDALWCLAGESVAISPAVVFPLTKQAGRNVLLVGSEDQTAAAVIAAMTASLVKSARCRIIAVQGAKPTDAWVLKLPQFWRESAVDLQSFDSRGADAALKSVHELLQQRIALDCAGTDDATSPSNQPPVCLCLLQLGRLRTLRRDDDFSMGSFGETELKPDKLLEEILRDGPSHGIFTVIWVENCSTVQRWLSRAALREIEIRLLMRMSGNDSTNLIDSVAASRLGEHVMLVFDEATGQEQKFRPFATSSIEEIFKWSVE